MDKKFLCGTSVEKHFIKEPLVLLSCGHAACKNCLPIDIIKCGVCNKRVDLKYDQNKAKDMYAQFKYNLDVLFGFLKREMSIEIGKFKSFYR
jgi:hypothetical protein